MAYSDESGEDEATLFLRLKGWLRDDRRAQSSFYKEVDTDFGFYAGGDQQWNKADITELEKAEKPYTTFNFIAPSVSAVNGMEVSNRQQVKFLPRTTQSNRQPAQPAMPGMPPVQPVPGADDQGPAETLTAAHDYLRDQCDAEDEESDAFQDCAICGMGWTETRVDFEENPDGDMKIDRCDPGEMGWDSAASKRNLIDSRRFHRVRRIDTSAALEMFPGYEIEDIDASWAREQNIGDEPHDAERAKFYGNDQSERSGSKKQVTIAEITWYEVKTSYRVADAASGEVLDVEDKAELGKIKKRAAAVGITLNVATAKKREYRQAFLGATEILGEKNGDVCQSQKSFKFKPITGWRDRNKRQWMGIVRAMRDPQKWANALYSSTLNTIMTSGKGIMAERSAFENANKAEADWAQSGNIVFLKEGALSGSNPKIREKLPTPLPPGLVDMMQFALQAMRGVSGVNLETLGGVDRDQAASLEYQRRQAATTILAPFFDGLRRYRKEQGRLAMDLIKQYLSDGRLIRVVGPDYEQYVPLVKQDDVLEYDIIVSESPTSPNQKEASWATIQQMLPVVGKNLGPKSMAALMKASPLPEASVKEFKDAADQEQQEAAAAPPPPEVMKIQAEIGKIEADTKLKQQEAAIREMEVGLAMQTTQLDMADRQSERQHKTAMRQMDMADRQAEMQGAAEVEFSKAAGGDMPAKFDALGRGLEALARATASNAMTTQELARMIAAPRRTDLVIQDGMPVGAISSMETLQ